MSRFFFILLFIFPFATYAQVVIPKFPIDSVTKFVTYVQMDAVAGAKKDKLAAILRDWSVSNLKLKNVSVLKGNGDTTILTGTGSITGLYTYSAAGYLAKMNYLAYFKVSVVCLSEKYKMVLDNFQLGLSNENLPVEDFYKLNLPGQKQDANMALADLYKMYSAQLYDLNASINSSLKRLSRYVEKAKNKGELN